jgi:hypothetical protein
MYALQTFSGGSLHFSQGSFLAYYVDVILNIRSRWHEGEQRGDESGAAHALKQMAVPQCLRNCDQIDRLAGIPKLD